MGFSAYSVGYGGVMKCRFCGREIHGDETLCYVCEDARQNPERDYEGFENEDSDYGGDE
jgi:RecJ-like exonuclease